jgi:hypothetical protein
MISGLLATIAEGGHHHVRAIHVDGFMRIEDCGAQFGEALRDGRGFAV